MYLSRAVNILWAINTVLTVILLIRLWSSGLARIYRWFWWFLFVNAAEAIIAFPLRKSFFMTANLYMAARSIGVVISVFLVMDLYRFALVAHPAIARAGRRWVGYFLGLACAVAAASLFALPILGPGKSQVMYRFYAFERTADSAVMLFLVFASGFLIWFPVRVSKNVAIFISGFVPYFLARWAGILAVGFRHTWTGNADFAMMTAIMPCLAAAIVLLRPEGEKLFVITGHRWNPEEMDHLNRQLIAINTKAEQFFR